MLRASFSYSLHLFHQPRNRSALISPNLLRFICSIINNGNGKFVIRDYIDMTGLKARKCYRNRILFMIMLIWHNVI